MGRLCFAFNKLLCSGQGEGGGRKISSLSPRPLVLWPQGTSGPAANANGRQDSFGKLILLGFSLLLPWKLLCKIQCKVAGSKNPAVKKNISACEIVSRLQSFSQLCQTGLNKASGRESSARLPRQGKVGYNSLALLSSELYIWKSVWIFRFESCKLHPQCLKFGNQKNSYYCRQSQTAPLLKSTFWLKDYVKLFGNSKYERGSEMKQKLPFRRGNIYKKKKLSACQGASFSVPGRQGWFWHTKDIHGRGLWLMSVCLVHISGTFRPCSLYIFLWFSWSWHWV